MEKILGLHHMTAITNDAQTDVDFYTKILGLRLVKITVNFDDPSAYHFYYADGAGSPGSTLTTFPYGGGRQGKIGAGQVTTTQLSVPPGSLGYWIDRFAGEAVPFDMPVTRGDEEALAFESHDGLQYELVESPDFSPGVPTPGSDVPEDKAIARMHAVTITHHLAEPTRAVLTELMGMTPVAEFGSRTRYAGADGGSGTYVDLVEDPQARLGQGGHGTVHHVAFRTATAETQLEWRSRILEAGLHVSPVMNRDYFQSIYFREPGGVLFEIATLNPGFDLDEPRETMGTSLRLPQQFEPMRSRIEQSLPPLRLPSGANLVHEMSFQYRFQPAEDPSLGTALLLLHGTGGDENDLLPLGETLLPGAAMLSPRGRISEGGMNRFFRRFAEGVFDYENLKEECDALAQWLQTAVQQHGLEGKKLAAVGFSNGANIANALMLRHPQMLAGGAFIRGMVTLENEASVDLTGKRVMISSGRYDPIVPTNNVERLAQIFRDAGADVELLWLDTGHNLTREELPILQRWLSQF